MQRIEMIGKSFNRWTVVERAASGPRGETRYRCRCSCGVEKIVFGKDVRRGASKSCGCLRDEAARWNAKHGATRNGRTAPEWRSWVGMKQRCRDPNQRDWPLYGGRGIQVCARWQDSFANFLADMGLKPSAKHTLDRIDNDGNYEPDNCRWATPSEQAFNRRPKRQASEGGAAHG